MADSLKALLYTPYLLARSPKAARKTLTWKTPATLSANWFCCAWLKSWNLFAKFCNTLVAGSIAPVVMSRVSTPIARNFFWTSVLPILVKMVLNALPITAPPRAVLCCTAVVMANNSSMLTPASTADEPTRDIALARSSELTAKA